jgi:hypothetical protein
MKMSRKHCKKTFITFMVLLASVASVSCADTSSGVRPRPQITSCPPGLILICESRQQPSKGGAEEEIPQYERCRCEPHV